MAACAWVLERNGRLQGRDAWAAVGGERPVGLGGVDAEIFRAEQRCCSWQARAGKPLPIDYLYPWVPAGASGLDQHVAI